MVCFALFFLGPWDRDQERLKRLSRFFRASEEDALQLQAAGSTSTRDWREVMDLTERE